MQQRLGLAVALVARPDFVVLDEPTSALDPLGRADVRDIVLGLRERGVAVLLNSHLIGESSGVRPGGRPDRGRVAAVGHARRAARSARGPAAPDRRGAARPSGGLATGRPVEREGEWFTRRTAAEDDGPRCPTWCATWWRSACGSTRWSRARISLEERLSASCGPAPGRPP
jgi:ABC-2 type transport system ATP-binding protein